MTRTHKKLHIRALSLLLVMVNLLTLMPLPTHSEETGSSVVQTAASPFAIALDGAHVSTMTLYTYEKKEINVEGSIAADAYQWQILHPEKAGLWINIYDATAGYLPVSLALIKNMLTPENTAQLRCRVRADGSEQYTSPVTIFYDPTVEMPLEIPETTIPEETVPETTIPETTVPEETIPETTVPETTVPEETVPEETIPEETVPEETIPETTVPETTVPETTIPEATIPEAPAMATEPVAEPTEETAAPETIPEITTETAVVTAPALMAEETAPTDPTEATEATDPTDPTEAADSGEDTPALIDDGTDTSGDASTETTVPTTGNDDDSTDSTEPTEGVQDTEFVTVTIDYIRYDYAKDEEGKLIQDSNGNYVLNEGNVAFTSYVASLQRGSDLDTVVPSPTMIGYDRFLYDEAGNALGSGNSVTINKTDITQNITYTVKYIPALVDYEIRYFFQNIYDDMYVEDASLKASVTRQGHTGTTPPADLIKPDVVGFTCLYYEPDFIAADGSTVFASYYERDYYLMEFDCAGGYGAETLYVRYGSYISVPNPVKAGYVFNGWDMVRSVQLDGNGNPVKGENGKHIVVDNLADNSENELPATMPPYNTAYIALWGTIGTNYTIIYWAENANDGYYSYWGTATGDAESSTSIVPTDVAKLAENSAASKGLTDAAHFTLNEAKTAASNPATVTVEGDGSTVINVYYNRNAYTIDFIWGSDGSAACAHEHTHTAECYQYYCDTEHKHTASCYVCNQIQHSHIASCCSLYHEHDDSCLGNCSHTHGITCYTSSNVTVASNQTGFTNVKNTAGDNPTEGVIYRYGSDNRSDNRTYYNYIYINNTWYYLGTGSGNTIAGLSWSGSNPNRDSVAVSTAANQPSLCTHTHESACYSCGKAEHTHGEDDTCNLANCPSNGVEHTHSATCYLCGKDEVPHTDDCCSLTEHTHASCTTDNCTHTQHGIECYTFTGGTVSTTPTTGISPDRYGTYGDVTVYRRQSGRNYYYYVLLNGSYYQISDFSWQNFEGTFNCQHEHTSSCYSCTIPVHTHGDGQCNINNCSNSTHHYHSGDCYTCGYNHVHSGACNYRLTCILTEHTHGSGCTSSSSNNLVYSITAKYDSDITRVWKSDPIHGHLENGIVWQSDITDKYYSFLEKMPGYDVEMTYTEWSGSEYNWHYYLEVSPYEDTTGLTLRTDGGVTYKKYHSVTVHGNSISLTYEEDYFPITGYTQRDSSVPSFSNRTAYLYYRINSHQLKYYNWSANGPAPAEQTMIYNQPLADKEISKEVMEKSYYPDGLEPGAYEFGGWYTSPGCYAGSEVDWDNEKMPDADYEIYAKWTPVIHNVYFYYDYADIDYDHLGQNTWDQTDANGNPVTYPIRVSHGELLGTTYNSIPEAEEGYSFIGWFYFDEDNKKRFAPDTMEVTSDLHLFAEWTTSIDTTYEVKYVLKEAVSGENTQDGNPYAAGALVADTISAHSSAGQTKTFNSKALGDLYPAFRKKFFPTTNSHSILMDRDGTKNTYTFEYVYDDTVYYKVRYLEMGTNKVLATEVVKSTDMAIVTEKFKPISEYIPQSYYIRKTLASDGNANENSVIDDNVITFYYVRDTKHGMYSIEYYLEKANPTNYDTDGDGYSSTGEGELEQLENHLANNFDLAYSAAGPADLKTEIAAEIKSYPGYEHVVAYNTVITYKEDGSVDETLYGVKDDKNQPYGIVDYTGLSIKIYYKRLSYPYKIEYREAETDAVLKTVIEAQLPFDSVVEHTAPQEFTLTDMDTGVTTTYEYYLQNPTTADLTKSMTIRAFTGTDNPNVLVFYYNQKPVQVFYHAVCLDPNVAESVKFGIVSLNSEKGMSADTLGGSKATARSGFEFVGWYKDEGCTQPVDTSWVTEETNADTNTTSYKLKPQAFNNNDGEAFEDHYYALFEPVKRNLTITKEPAEYTELDDHDSFLFKITGTNALGQDVEMIVSIQGEGSVTIEGLYCGTYTVTELTNWSWTYSNTDGSEKTATLTVTNEDGEEGNAEVSFTNSPTAVDWLHGEINAENHYTH